MNNPKASIVSAEHDGREACDETYIDPQGIEIRFFDSLSPPSRSTSRPYGDARLHGNDVVQMEHTKREQMPPSKDDLPEITLKPRSKRSINTRSSRYAVQLTPNLFVPSLSTEKVEKYHMSESSPITFTRKSTSMTITKKPSLAINGSLTVAKRPYSPSHSPLEDKDVHPVTSSIKRKRSFSVSSPFLSIDESTPVSTQAKDLVVVENEHTICVRHGGTTTPTSTPVYLIPKPQPMRREHEPRRDERVADRSSLSSVKTSTTIALSASSAFSLTF